ncbi:electron transfer flavoprotein subunit alpha/FixB family protein [Haloarcula salinisoli]|uniref:Electron transfer flavoprotein subunit alpha/FixB family protein n=1 Tax=Haloarcula salinisoli TaxID=2487746 RepID=A0A8J8C9V9_9EURY|nr:electron transfer flavoprotein subunit alpha/FixB family protein [Halomicroarcula salinisoli]MBX0287690.1 electron transfer flavoprotein subunit alpha/FixB family protein [Halomicroarcula salinisoli]MBX0304619.1 electron transfer flavoprotein subunit alpha/FixB family protein [Halomicroarcula salinisoli]
MTVLTVAEHRGGRLREVSRAAQTAGLELAEATDDPVHTAAVGGDAERFAEQLARDGVDVVHTVAEGEAFTHDIATRALTQLVGALDARVVLAPNSATGLAYAPALAARLDWPIVTDAVELDAADGLTVAREGDGTVTRFAVDSGRAVVTLRPGEWRPAEATGDAEIRSFAADIDDGAVRSRVTGSETLGDRDLTEADVVVAVGRGIGAEANLDVVFDLAEAIDATVAAASPPVKLGWLPAERQVGQSGVTVAPDVYLAIGISGATQHLAGMRESDTTVAINSDPTAPIFDVADYGIVADFADVVPALVAAFDS